MPSNPIGASQTGGIGPFAKGCMEGVYACLYGYSMLLLALKFANWCIHIWDGYGEVNFELTIFQGFSAILTLILIIQLSRVYFYVHYLDHKLNIQTHFMFHIVGPQGVVERLLRLAAGGAVILLIEINSNNNLFNALSYQVVSQTSDFSQLMDFVKYSVLVFSILFMWDINLAIWRWRMKRKKPGVYCAIKASLDNYDYKAKMLQRIAGICLSLSFILLIRYPGGNYAYGIAGGCLVAFVAAWIKDYKGDGFIEGTRTFISENTSFIGTVYSLLRLKRSES